MSHFGCESFEYKVDNAAREASAGAGHAFAAGGRRVMDSEIGLSQGTRRDATQRFEDFPGENPSRGSIERWGREAMSKMTLESAL